MGMLWRYAICGAVMIMPSCRKALPPQRMAGIVTEVSDTALAVRNASGDSLLRFVVDETTLFGGGDAVEGNAVEVSYRAVRRSGELHALKVTGDETYAEVLGRWATDARAELPVDVELLPHGALRQLAPPSLLRLDGWYVDGETEGRIHVTGEAVIVRDSVERYPFTVRAELHEGNHGDMLVVEGPSGAVVRLHRVER